MPSLSLILQQLIQILLCICFKTNFCICFKCFKHFSKFIVTNSLYFSLFFYFLIVYIYPAFYTTGKDLKKKTIKLLLLSYNLSLLKLSLIKLTS